MNLQSDDIGQWGDSLDSFKPEYTAIKVWNPIQFYRLEGRKTTIVMENFTTIIDMHYCIYSPSDKHYYFKGDHHIPLWDFLFSRVDPSWDSYDQVILGLVSKIQDGNIYLLLTDQQINDVSDMLIRLYKSHFVGEGKVDYKIWIRMAETSLQYERYKERNAGVKDYLTTCNRFDKIIRELWEKTYGKK